MRRLTLPLLVLIAATLAGCGNKGPLQLPATSRTHTATPPAPAVATSTARPSRVQH